MTTPLPHMGRTFLLWKGIKLVLRQAKEWFDAYHLQLNDERTQHFLCTLKSVADSDAEGSVKLLSAQQLDAPCKILGVSQGLVSGFKTPYLRTSGIWRRRD
ncbi:hypothetical protein J6590_099237 [Homalodisca vitripennis]|nr:hypothetical protein J6590_099237 [Homalodisca vitripennis]